MAKQYHKYPDMVIDPQKKYQATIKTEKGDIELDLFAVDAPKTVNNFVFLARDNFYDGLTFHRVIDNFMAQGGCPYGTGTGGPGYKFEDETRTNPHKHETGSLSMANAGPNTNGSQFFICHAPQPHLNGKHTVFGQVRRGINVVTSLRNGDKIKEIVITES
jgi:peptidyl-prolyl cis-trans isomerase B (cyclophilin B)